MTKINEEKVICPSASSGGKNWPAGAYSPLTNTMYMPLQNMCMTATTTIDTRDPSKVYGLRMVPQLAPGTKMVGTVWAISAETGMTTWKVEQPAGMLSLAATAGGLVFGGDANGHFKAFDDTQRQGVVGHEPRVVGQRLSDQLRRRRQAVRRRRSPDRRSSPTPPRPDAGVEGRHGPNVFVFGLP